MARLLIDRGYKDVRPLLGGFDAWVEKGFPVDVHKVLPAKSLVTPAQQTTSA